MDIIILQKTYHHKCESAAFRIWKTVILSQIPVCFLSVNSPQVNNVSVYLLLPGFNGNCGSWILYFVCCHFSTKGINSLKNWHNHQQPWKKVSALDYSILVSLHSQKMVSIEWCFVCFLIEFDNLFLDQFYSFFLYFQLTYLSVSLKMMPNICKASLFLSRIMWFWLTALP